jgi:hypothetical protein
MLSENIKIPLILLLLLVIFSFIPIPQLIIIYLNAFILVLFDFILINRNLEMFYITNIIGMLFCLIGYIYSVRINFKIMFSLLLVFFSVPFYNLILENFEISEYPYFLPLIIIAILTTTPLFLIGLIKENLNEKVLNNNNI